MNLLLAATSQSASVPTFTITCMTLTAAFAFLSPFLLLLYLWKWKRADIRPFLVGAVIFILFTFVLENIIASILFGGLIDTISSNIWLYAIFGGLLTGIFEETGRFVAFKTVLKKDRDNDYDSLMYGAGHAGVDVIISLGFVAISEIAVATMINNGQVADVTKDLTGESLEQMNNLINSLINNSPMLSLAGIFEKLCAYVLHLSLSILVWFAVKNRDKFILYPLAIILHAIPTTLTSIVSKKTDNLFYTELVIFVCAIAIAVFAHKVWKENCDTIIEQPAFLQEPIKENTRKAKDIIRKANEIAENLPDESSEK